MEPKTWTPPRPVHTRGFSQRQVGDHGMLISFPMRWYLYGEGREYVDGRAAKNLYDRGRSFARWRERKLLAVLASPLPLQSSLSNYSE